MANTPASMRFVAAEKTSAIINRQVELDMIRRALCESGKSLRVVLIRGPRGAEGRNEPEGGYGKTRLLEEVARLTDPADPGGAWRAFGDVAVSRLIDLIDIRLHAQSNFLREARNSFLGRADFMAYDDAFGRYERRLSRGAEYHAVREAAEHADQSFLVDYRRNASARRMVWLLDTVEQLAVSSSEWLIKRGLLQPEDMKARTLQWLKRQIEGDALPNTTLICAGRGREGRWFFDEIASATRQKHGNEAVVEVYAEPFMVDDTRRYFAALATDLRERTGGDQSEAGVYQRAAKALDELARLDSDRVRVLTLYTGGVPVRLALYAQLLVEGRTIPDRLQLPWPKVIAEVKTEDPLTPTPELEFAQWQVEDHFINLLFSPRDTQDRRYRILQMLVRARRGLTAEQLHFVLDNPTRRSPKDWELSLERSRIREIDEQLKQMATWFLVKRRSPWWRLADEVEGPVLGAQRHGLQDEIYRIYAEHMSLSIERRDERLQRIWDRLSDKDRERYQANRQTEKKARDQLYKQLRDWAKYQQEKLQTQRRKYQEEDERSLRIANPIDARQIGFPVPGDTERALRVAISEAERELELEHMHYALLLDPERGFNEDYTDLANEWYKANDEEAEYLAQAELWRVLTDTDALKFVDFVLRQTTIRRQETPRTVLRRAAQQEDVSRWIKRFVLRKEYDRAIEFTRDVEQAVERLQQGDAQDQKDWASWMHTFARSDRLCWSKYAQILKNQDVPEAIHALEAIVADLKKLADCTIVEVVIPAKDARSGRDEQGFRGTISVTGHPAYISVRRVISYIYNFLGYAYVNLGKLRQSIDSYGKALYYLRETGAVSQRATILNNLSRALSDMGRERAVRVCRDGLELRRNLGADVPIAFSHNTLALIYNDRNRPEDAWPEAVKAVAYCRRAEEPRGLGLALLQLGEALRRMAIQARYGRVLPADPDSIYSAADDVLNEAHSLFLPPDPESPDYALRIDLNEPMRLVEAKIELGCLFRDRIRAAGSEDLSPQWLARYRKALEYLQTAADMARDLGLKRHELDARVNLGWTHFYAGDMDEAAKALDAAESVLQERNAEYFIRPKSPAEPAGFAPESQHLDEFFIFSQLSKAYNLRGLMILQQFKKRIDEIDLEFPGAERREARQEKVHGDPAAQQCLERIAECYTLGTAYAQLYSPRSSALSMLYDRLYDFLKKLNGQELDDFHRYVIQQRNRYPSEEVKRNIEDLGNIDQFMHEVFGLSQDMISSGGADGN